MRSFLIKACFFVLENLIAAENPTPLNLAFVNKKTCTKFSNRNELPSGTEDCIADNSRFSATPIPECDAYIIRLVKNEA